MQVLYMATYMAHLLAVNTAERRAIVNVAIG